MMITTSANSVVASLLLASSVVLINANVQETLIGITGRDFVILGADAAISSSGSISWTAQIDKIADLGNIAAASAGNVADSDRLVGLLRAHCNIRKFESSVGSDVEYITMGEDHEEVVVQQESHMHGLTVEEVAHLARYQIAESIRSRGRLDVCLLIAGMSESVMDDDDTLKDFFAERLQRQVQQATNQDIEPLLLPKKLSSRPCLFWVDQYGSLQALRYGAHGFASNFLLSLLDQGYSEDMTKDEAIELMKKCFEQLRVRYIIHSPFAPNIKCIDNDGCRVVA